MACWIFSALLCAVVGGSPDCTIVHFTADWCEPCRQLEPALQQLRQEGWTIQTVDTDRQPELVQQFRIKSLPTLAILSRDQEVDRLVGAASYERILQRVQRVAARNQSGPPRAVSPASQASASQPSASPLPALTAIVRGQSPEVSGFPLLASNNVAGGRAAGALEAVGEGVAGEGVAGEVSMNSRGDQHPTNAAAMETSRGAPATAERRTSVEGLAALRGLAAMEGRAASGSQPLSVEQAIARAAAATVRIRVDEANTTAYGTGTIVDVHGEDALILTCGHLFRDMQPHSQLTIDLFPGTAQEVNLPSVLIDFKAEGEDIGVISFRLPLHIEPVPILGRGERVVVGQPAFSFGCDRGANPTRRDTKIKNINRYLGADNIEIVGAPVVGRSGGGLFDMQGRLIGVCNAANAEDDEGIYAFADVVFTQIERLGLSELYEGDSPRVYEGDSPRVGPPQTAQLASTAIAAQPHGLQPIGNVPAFAGGMQANSAAQQASGLLQWPDQSASVPQLPAPEPESAGTVTPAFAASPITANTTRQVICIVRDSGGQDRVITIDAPPEQLLQMIQQQSQQQSQRR